MEFEWDDEKNRINEEKHLITFEEASAIFAGDVLTFIDDRFDYGETRLISFGELYLADVEATVVIVVVHTERSGRVRIISARRASRKEREAYYEHV